MSTSAWKVKSPLRQAKPEILARLRSPGFGRAFKLVFVAELSKRAGEDIIDRETHLPDPTGVFGKFIATGLMPLDPYGDPNDPSLPPQPRGSTVDTSLDTKSQELILVAILAAESSKLNLAFHCAAAIMAGASVSEVEATLSLVGRYTGAENAMDAIAMLRFTETAIAKTLGDNVSDDAKAANELLTQLKKLEPGT